MSAGLHSLSRDLTEQQCLLVCTPFSSVELSLRKVEVHITFHIPATAFSTRDTYPSER
jgi:hypothetical protein